MRGRIGRSRSRPTSKAPRAACQTYCGAMFDPNTAYHEAGHVVAHCHFGLGIDSAHVLRRGQTEMEDNRGRAVKCSGLTQPILHFNDHLWGRSLEQLLGGPCPGELHRLFGEALLVRGTRVLICDYAGPWVEARKRKMGLAAVMLSGGYEDMESFESILKWLAPDEEVREQLAKRCERIAEGFLREPSIWQQVEAVANILIRDGIIKGDHPLLAGIKGMRPLPS